MKRRRRQRSFFEDSVGGENFSWKRRRGVNKQTKRERLLLVVRPVGVVEGWSVSLEGGYRSVLPKVDVAKTPVVGVGEGHHSVSLEVVQCRRRSSSIAKKKKWPFGVVEGCLTVRVIKGHTVLSKFGVPFNEGCESAGCLWGVGPLPSAPKASTVKPSQARYRSFYAVFIF